MKRNKWLTYFLLAALLLAGTIDSLVMFVTDYFWFNEVGYAKTFLVRTLTSLKLGIPVFLIGTLIFHLYINALRKRFEAISGIVQDKALKRRVGGFLLGTSAVMGALYAFMFTGATWLDWLGFMNQTPFGVADPLFGHDVSFYFFVLPLLKRFLGQGLTLLFMLTMLTVVYILLLLNLRPTSHDHVYDLNEFRFRHDIRSVFSRNIFANAIMKIGILGALALALIALLNVISAYDLVYARNNAAYGAGFTAVHVALPGYWLLAGVSLLGAGLVLYGAIRRRWKLMAAGPLVLLALAVVINLAEVGVQRFYVEPDERAKERPYITQNIASTQAAFNLKDIQTLEFPAEDGLSLEDLDANADILENIRINDFRPLKMTVNQLQGIRLYYEFNDVDTDRYLIDGKYRQVFISARELNPAKLETKTWINQHLQFTHGYGVALAPVNEVTVEGQPKLIIKNIPPVSSVDSLKISRPEFYFGEFATPYIIVNAKEQEFDYPKGSDNVYTTYQGNAGIRLSFVNKVLFSIRERNATMLISNALMPESRIIINRNILSRVRTIMPFLSYDPDPYIVINQEDGRLYWLLDGYTASSLYPYSTPIGQPGLNYIRNSVKVTVDAYDGSTRFYISDAADPVIRTYAKIFPDLLKPMDQMPKGLAGHVRYPKGMLDIQAEAYLRYHVSNPDVFYNGEDVWDIATEKYMEETTKVEANYTMFRLPGETQLEYLLNIPFTPKDKSNMNALLMARNDGAECGKLFLYRFPKDRLVQGPQMLEARIDQDTEISRQLTLWGQKGSSILRGNLMPIPVGNSIIYVEPIYLKAEGERSLPEMKRVVVGYGERVVMAETLAQGFEMLFGKAQAPAVSPGEAPSGGTPSDGGAGALVNQAKALMEESSQTLQELKDVLDQLTRKIEELQGTGTPAPEAVQP